MAISVTLGSFEGPLDLLLQLVRRSEISVWEVRIQQICEQFMAYTRQLEVVDVDMAGDFLVMAATLMRIKARLLLPRPEPLETAGEEQPEVDEEEQMLTRLLLYEGFREAAEQLELMADEAAVFYTRGQVEERPAMDESDPLAGVTLLTLAVIVQQVLAELPSPSITISTERYTLNGQIVHIRHCLGLGAKLGFRQLLSEQPTRTEIIATFLAILELVRMQEISVSQEQGSQDVILWRRDKHGTV